MARIYKSTVLETPPATTPTPTPNRHTLTHHPHPPPRVQMFYVLITSSQPPSCCLHSVPINPCSLSHCKIIDCLSWRFLERKLQKWPYVYNQWKHSIAYFEIGRSGSQLSIWNHIICNITAIMHVDLVAFPLTLSCFKNKRVFKLTITDVPWSGLQTMDQRSYWGHFVVLF